MLSLLSKDNYYTVKPLVREGFFSVQLETVIDSSNPGFIYVDSVESPRNGLVFHKGECGFYCIGDSRNEEFHQYLKESLPELKQKLAEYDLDEFQISGDSPAWNSVFDVLFSAFDRGVAFRESMFDGIAHRYRKGKSTLTMRFER